MLLLVVWLARFLAKNIIEKPVEQLGTSEELQVGYKTRSCPWMD